MATISSLHTFQKTLDAKPNEHSIVKPGELVDIVEMTPLTLSDHAGFVAVILAHNVDPMCRRTYKAA